MKDFDKMTQEEIREWAVSNWQEGMDRARAEGRPAVPVSRAKQEDYPHWEQHGFGFRLHGGALIRRWSDDEQHDGVVVGLREVADGGPLALVVDLDGPHALRRAGRGEVWATDLTADRCAVPERDVVVLAWRLAAAPDPAVAVPAPGSVATWTVRTNGVDGQL